jgi:hypothetical protein
MNATAYGEQQVRLQVPQVRDPFRNCHPFDRLRAGSEGLWPKDLRRYVRLNCTQLAFWPGVVVEKPGRGMKAINISGRSFGPNKGPQDDSLVRMRNASSGQCRNGALNESYEPKE